MHSHHNRICRIRKHHHIEYVECVTKMKKVDHIDTQFTFHVEYITIILRCRALPQKMYSRDKKVSHEEYKAFDIEILAGKFPMKNTKQTPPCRICRIRKQNEDSRSHRIPTC